jgi:hypothetical protein
MSQLGSLLELHIDTFFPLFFLFYLPLSLFSSLTFHLWTLSTTVLYQFVAQVFI